MRTQYCVPLGFLCLFVICMPLSGQTHELVIPTWAESGLYVNDQIMGDSLETGARVDPDRIYVLKRGGMYRCNATIQNNGWVLRIKAETGTGSLPIVLLTPGVQSALPGYFVRAGGNVQLNGLVLDGYDEPTIANLAILQGGFVNTTTAGVDIVLDECLLVNTNGNHIRADYPPRLVKITNCLFANMGYLGRSNLGAGKAVDVRAGSVDSLILINNTFVNSQDRIIRHYNSTAPIQVLVFDHNTVVNSMGYHGVFSLGKVGTGITMTNNLFIDPFALGNDTDATRQAEFTNSGEVDAYGKPRMTWVMTEPNVTTQWTVRNNFYAVSTAGQAFYNAWNFAGVTGEGSPLTWHINGRIGADSLTAFRNITLQLANTPNLMTAMMNWYRSPAGGNKTKNTPSAAWNSAYDYDRRSLAYYLDSLDCTYSAISPAFTGADGGYPAGDLNWYPAKKAAWSGNPPPVTSLGMIRDLQYVSPDSLMVADALQLTNPARWMVQTSPALNDTVEITGVCVIPPRVNTYTSSGYNLLLADTANPANPAFRGIFCRILYAAAGDTANYPELALIRAGDVVRMRGRVDEYPLNSMNSITQFTILSGGTQVLGTAPVPPVPLTAISEFYRGRFSGGSIRYSTGEPLEGGIVELHNVWVDSILLAANGTVILTDSLGNTMPTYDPSRWFTLRAFKDPSSTFRLPEFGSRINVIRGWITTVSGATNARGYVIAPQVPGDFNLPPIAPITSLPANGAVDQPGTVTLTWSRSTGAVSYLLRISADPAFSQFNPALNAAVYLPADTVQTVTGLNSGTTYYWRVCAVNADGRSAFSIQSQFTVAAAFSHDLIVPPFVESGLYLNDVIASDINPDNSRLDPERVYVLRRGGEYRVNAPIDNLDWMLRIRAEEGTGPRPVIFLMSMPATGNPPGQFVNVRGDVWLKNLIVSGYYEPIDTNLTHLQGSFLTVPSAITSALRIIVDGCILTNTNGNHVRVQSPVQTVRVINSVFANMGYLGRSNLGAGKAVDIRNCAIDSLILVNNTFVNSQDRIIRHRLSSGPIRYLLFDHNTIVNGMAFHGMLALGMMGSDAVITNNLFIDPFALGNDTDMTRQAEFDESGELDPFGRGRMLWIASVPNEYTAWTVANNYYSISPAGRDFFAAYAPEGVTGEGAPLSWHINGRLGADSMNAFHAATLSLIRTPNLMTSMMHWYRSPFGGNKTKNTPSAAWNGAYDYDRRGWLFYRDSLDCSYPTMSPVYTGAAGGFPAGDLNWFPLRKGEWELGRQTQPALVSVPVELTYPAIAPGSAAMSRISVSGVNLVPVSDTIRITVAEPYRVSRDSMAGFASSLLIPYSGGVLSPMPVYVRFGPTAGGTFEAAVSIVGGGAVRMVPLHGSASGFRLWSASIAIRDSSGLGSGKTLTFGQDSQAGDGLDAGLGELELPPLPPAGVFDARFMLPVIPAVGSLADYRDTARSARQWTLTYQAGSGGFPVVLAWNPASLPGGSLYLRDAITGTIVNVDMKSQSSYAVTNSALTTLKIYYSPDVTVPIALENGWNMISLPVAPQSYDAATLFPMATAPVYGYTSGYTVEQTLANGKGYWLKTGAAQTVQMTGGVSTAPVALPGGWTMIGVRNRDIPVNTITTAPSGIITTQFFGFRTSSGYLVADTLKAGKGYWIKTSGAGVLNATVNAAKSAAVQNPEEKWNSLSVRDAEGRCARLYAAPAGLALERYALPPLPPAEIFDVRYADGSCARNLAGAALVSIQGARFPLTVRAEGVDLHIADAAGGVVFSHNVKKGTDCIIASPLLTTLRVEEIVLPAAYELQQNYPNPFNPRTTIRFGVPENVRVRIVVYNILGQEMAVPVDGIREAGYYTVAVDAGRIPSGTYFYRLEAGSVVLVKKMLVIK